MRVIFFLLGLISLILGCLGVILPFLPTVPFFLLTTICFAKSSAKFHNWFISTKIYKKHMSGLAEHRSMTLRYKIILLTLVSTMLCCTMYFVDNPVASIIIPFVIAFKYYFFIFHIKTVSPTEMRALVND